ncbi:MAG: hypothetical protein KJ950_03860 [Proteobacteria bacterium]|nr:hypothetical protein [Pseudomonadota bacterium]MBU1688345.1 hypothetical protein [Pseudomonadota bacterium]
MKKALGFAVALGLVAGMASSAVASDILDFHGEARVRGLYSDVDGTASDAIRNYDQRYRFIINAKLADNVMVGSRITLLNDEFAGAMSTTNNNVDRAYIQLGILGGTWILGRQEVSWGNKLMSWGNTADRIKAVYDLGGGQKVGAFLQKDVESKNPGGDLDKDSYSAFYVGSAGDFKFGVIGVDIMNDSTPADDDGIVIDAYVNGTAGGMMVAAEVNMKMGDAYGTDDDLGFFAMAGMGLGDGMSVGAAAAYAANGYKADDDFTPTLLFGKSQVTAISDFGDTQTTGDDTVMAVLGQLGIKLSDKMSAKVLGAYAILSDKAETTLIEVDGSLEYALAQNTVYKFGVAIGMPDKYSADDEMLISAGHSVEVKW